MKKILRFICTLIAITFLLSYVMTTASFDDYDDVAGHWAQSALRQAYNDGLIIGYNRRLFPDESISASQALTILCRVLGAAETADISSMGLFGDEWYFEYAAKAAHLGLISSHSSIDPYLPMSRQDAFCMLAEAFQLVAANPEMSYLERFSDHSQVAVRNRRALASLISLGYIHGYDGKIYANGDITRAAFLSVVYRVVGNHLPSSDASGNYSSGVMLQGSAKLSGINFGGGIWLDCSASDIAFDSVSTPCAVIRSHALDSLSIGGSTRIDRLTLAAQSGDMAVFPSGAASIGTLVAGTGSGTVITGGIGSIEITGNGRYVTITDNVDSVIVAGNSSTIRIQYGATVGKLELLTSAHSSRVIADGTVRQMSVASLDSIVSGIGKVNTLILHRPDTQVRISYDNISDLVDHGLAGATVTMIAPPTLPVGNTLNVGATIGNALPGKLCSYTWYVDGIQASQGTFSTGEQLPMLSHAFEYSRTMQESSDIKLTVEYVTALGERHELFAESTIMLENYGKQYWMQLDTPLVLERVSLGYLGDFTLEWAQANDLDDYDKEVWINAKGYTSRSDYLLWINLAYQRVNIFERTDSGWAHIRTCIVGTGAPGRGTPPGVWTTSYKQVYGWTTATYTVAPVVRFMGSVGYAFHSRLYYPGTSNLQDPSIGFPISLGCVRMYDDDIWFIYDNIPDGTTVVVY